LWWGSVSESLELDPQLGADRLGKSFFLTLPSTVQLSRRLISRNFVGATAPSVVAALERVASMQKRWLWLDPNGFRNSAAAALVRQDPVAGFEEMKQALMRDPTSSYLHRVMALLAHRAGDHREWLEHLAEAEAVHNDPGWSTWDLTDEDERWIQLEALKRRMELYPRRRVPTALTLARVLRSRGEVGSAYELLRDFDHHPDVVIELARWELAAGDFESAAARVFLLAQRSSLPTSVRVHAWATLAEIYDHAGDRTSAVEAAQQALRLDPSSPAPHVALANLAERRGESSEVLGHLRRAWGVAPSDVGLLVRIATVAERAGELGDARLALERAIEVQPADPSLVCRLVDFHLRHGDYMQAAMRLSQGIDRFPLDERLLRLAERLRREVKQ
jgi:Tfp pilus assembly protein PilF